ncbi:MAG: AAA family ATPase [Chloroflexota bacterium]
MIHLRSISLPTVRQLPDAFPYNVPVIQSLDELVFRSPVTFLVGENGSGKSTLLEAIACAANLPTIGGEAVAQDPTLAEMRKLSKRLQWQWNKRTHRGFFMRSEDFFGFAKRVAQMATELRDELERVDEEYAGRSPLAKQYARMAFAGQLHDIKDAYGEGLDAQSHGESYLKLFQARFVPGGLYLMDEPEAPLSPTRQLTFLATLNLLVKQEAQFIIATHSPILLAYPGATILSFESGKIQQAAYEELEHVTITREFLNNPAAFLRHLVEG